MSEFRNPPIEKRNFFPIALMERAHRFFEYSSARFKGSGSFRPPATGMFFVRRPSDPSADGSSNGYVHAVPQILFSRGTHMNTIYRVVWNASTNSWVVASEMAKGRKKKGSRAAVVTTVVLGGAASVLAGPAMAGYQCPGFVGSSAYFQGAWCLGDGYIDGTGDIAISNHAIATSNTAMRHVLDHTHNYGSNGGDDYSSLPGGENVAIGYNSQAIGSANVALGSKSSAYGQYGVAVGSFADASSSYAVALGLDAQAKTFGSVALGQGSIADRLYAVSVGSASAQRQIIQVAKGTADTDAVNISQLKGVTSAMGGGTAVNPDGTIKNPSITIGGKTYTDLSSAITAAANGSGSGGSTDALNWNATTGAFDAKHGATATNKITDVANGTDTNDAVNVSQLKSAGFTLDSAGNVTTPAVTYDAGSVAAGKPTITLNPGTGNSKYFKNGDRTQGLLPAGRVISNVANAVQDTDATNLGQVEDLLTSTTSSGGGLQATPMLRAGLLGASAGSGVNTTGLTTTYKTAAYYSQVAGVGDSSGSTPPSDVARAVGAGAIAIGSNAYSKGTAGTAVGVQAYTSASDAVALGSGSVANTANAVSVGSDGTGSYTAYDASGNAYTIQNQANTRRIVNMAAGQNDNDAVNVAQLKGVTNAIGGGAGVAADGSITKPTITFGGKTYTDVASAITAAGTAASGGDALNWNTTTNAYDAKHGASATSKITDVAAGAVSATSTDVVNGSQLYGASNSTAAAIGGGSAVNPDGTISKPSITFGGKTYNDVSSAITAAGTAVSSVDALNWNATTGAYDAKHGASATSKITDVTAGALSATSTDAVNGSQLYATNQTVASNTTDITNIKNGKAGLVQQSAAGANLTVGAATDGAAVDFKGTAGNRKLINVAAGTVNATSTDVVNGSQLYGVSNSTAAAIGGGSAVNPDGTISKPNITFGGKTYNDMSSAITAAGTAASSVDALNWNATAGGFDAKHGSATTSKIIDVANGTNANDALNVGQLKSAGFTLDGTGNVTNAAVTYNAGTIASGKPTITLSAGTGNSKYFKNGDRTQGLLPAGTVISNVANGVQDTDAANVGQVWDILNSNQGSGLKAAPMLKAGLLGASAGSGVNTSGLTVTYKTAAYYSQVAGVGDSSGSTPPSDVARASGAGSIAIGSNAYTKATAGTAVGVQSYTTASDAVALGSGSVANTANTVSVGSDGTGSYTAYDPSGNAYTIQNQANTRRIVNMAAGQGDNDAVNVAQLKGVTSAMGGGAAVNPDGTIKNPTITINGNTYNDMASAIQAAAGTNGNVDALNWDATANAFSAKHGNAAQKITNVANGAVTSTSSDAINGSQLYGTAQSVADALGGGSTVDANGKVTKPKYTVAGNSVDGVDGAVSALDANMKSAKDGIDGLNADVANAVVYDDNSHSQITLNKGQAAVKLSNMAAGALSATSTDAVNGSQLYATNQALAGNTTAITDITNNINNGTIGLVQQASAGANLTVGAKTDGAAVDFTGTAGTRQLKGVSNGTAATDGVNVSQLQGVTDTIGGGAGVNADGTIKKPSITINGNTYNDMASAIQAAAGTNGNVDALNWDATANAFSAKHGNAAQKITNVANGAVTSTSSDAINGTQLYGTAQSVADALGGGSTVDANGKVTKPKYTVAGNSVDGVDGAVSALDAGIKNAKDGIDGLNGQMAAVKNGIDGLNADVANVVSYDDSTHTQVSLNKGGAAVKLSNVAPGALNATSTDAVNGSQLYATNQAVAGNTTAITNITNQINNGSVGLVQQAAAGQKLTVGHATDGTQVNFTGTAGDRELTGVANGVSDHSAINVAQLKPIIDGMGGGASIDPTTGAVTGPTYNIHNTDGSTTTVNNMGDAITNLDGRVTNNTTDITNLQQQVTNITNNGAPVKFFHANTKLADSVASGNETVAIGGGAKATANNAVAIGSNSVADRDNTVSVGSAGNERQITNVAAGTADTDAVNVSQLKAAGVINGDGSTNTAVTYDHNSDGTTNYNSVTLGGDSSTGGTVIHNIANGTAASDAVNKGQMDAAIAGVAAQAGGNPMFQANGDRATEQASATGNHATAMGANASATADNSVALGAGSVADRANTVSLGSAGHERQLTNVAAATSDTDAVNYQQYKSGLSDTLHQANSYTDQQIESATSNWASQVNDNFDKVNNKINQVNQQANKGIAAASALINVTPYVPGHTAVNAGVANYRGETALGVGISRWSDNGRFNVNGGVSAAQGDRPVVRVGVGYVF